MEATKICTRCNSVETVSDFNKRSASSDGYVYICKTCSVEVRQFWNENNRDRSNARERTYCADTSHRRISKNMHKILWSILKRGHYSLRTEQIIGLNKQTYLEWLSYNFEGEMCWANYGQLWCIDLVIPASAYDLTDEQQLLSCFNWKNIRPCLKKDNGAINNFICQFTIANHSIRVLGFIRKLRQLKLETFLNKFE